MHADCVAASIACNALGSRSIALQERLRQFLWPPNILLVFAPAQRAHEHHNKASESDPFRERPCQRQPHIGKQGDLDWNADAVSALMKAAAKSK